MCHLGGRLALVHVVHAGEVGNAWLGLQHGLHLLLRLAPEDERQAWVLGLDRRRDSVKVVRVLIPRPRPNVTVCARVNVSTLQGTGVYRGCSQLI